MRVVEELRTALRYFVEQLKNAKGVQVGHRNLGAVSFKHFVQFNAEALVAYLFDESLPDARVPSGRSNLR